MTFAPTSPAHRAGSSTTRMRSRPGGRLLLACLLALQLATSCSEPPPASTALTEEPTSSTSSTAGAREAISLPTRPVDDAVHAAGRYAATVEAQSERLVAPAFAARVQRVLVRPGDAVQRGQALAVVAMPTLAATMADALAARTREAAWSRRAHQLRQLRAQGMARLLDETEAETNRAEARAARMVAEAALAAAGLSPPGADDGDGDVDIDIDIEGDGDGDGDGDGRSSAPAPETPSGVRSLRADVDGVVLAVHARVGQTLDAGAPLVTLGSEAPPRVSAHIPTDVVATLKAAPREPTSETATTTTTTLSAIVGDRTVPLRLLTKAPVADPDGARQIWCEPVDEAGARALVPGSQIVLELGARGAHTLPRSAVLFGRDGSAHVVDATTGDLLPVRVLEPPPGDRIDTVDDVLEVVSTTGPLPASLLRHPRQALNARPAQEAR